MRKRSGEARENRHVKGRTGGAGKVNLLAEEDLVSQVRTGEMNFLLILDCVQDPHNLGAILRTADGAGVQAVVVPKDKSAGITDTVRRISVGAADSVPFVRVTNLSRAMKSLQDAGMWLVGTSDQADKTLYETDLKGSLGVVIGAEGDGLRRLTEEGCDFPRKVAHVWPSTLFECQCRDRSMSLRGSETTSGIAASLKTTLAEFTTGLRELPLPIRMVSDWHLGHPGAQVQAISQVAHLLEGAGTFVMAGDGREELVEGWRGRADQLWKELQELCEERGIEFVALTGNHDPEVSADGWMKLNQGRILVTHGDMIYDTASPWSKELFSNRESVEELVAGRTCSSLDERWQCAREVGYLLRPDAKMAPNFLGYLKLALWPPERLFAVGKVWSGFAREGDRFLNRFSCESEVLVCGHFHRPGRFRVGRRIIWNTGSLMKMSKGLMLDFDGSEITSSRYASAS